MDFAGRWIVFTPNLIWPKLKLNLNLKIWLLLFDRIVCRLVQDCSQLRCKRPIKSPTQICLFGLNGLNEKKNPISTRSKACRRAFQKADSGAFRSENDCKIGKLADRVGRTRTSLNSMLFAWAKRWADRCANRLRRCNKFILNYSCHAQLFLQLNNNSRALWRIDRYSAKHGLLNGLFSKCRLANRKKQWMREAIKDRTAKSVA